MVGFIWGYVCQQYIQTVYVLGAGVLLALLVYPAFSVTHLDVIISHIYAAGDPSLAYVQASPFEVAKTTRTEVF